MVAMMRAFRPLTTVCDLRCRHAESGSDARRAIAHRTALAFWLLLSATGCELFPRLAYEPAVFNPYPQLSRVAVAPFFNLSDEPTVDGRRFAQAYFAELQAVPGFDVVPLSVVETAIRDHGLEINSPQQARRLARLLGVDVVVIGAVTDYRPYYPPRCGLKVQWWAANPTIHQIPPGYGLPWDTPREEFIPEPLVFEAEMALARAELDVHQPPDITADELPSHEDPAEPTPPLPDEIEEDGTNSASYRFARPRHAVAATPAARPSGPVDAVASQAGGPPGAAGHCDCHAPGLIVPDIGPEPEVTISDRPVMSHTRIYHGHDRKFTDALSNYYFFRDDERFGGYHSYLQRSEDFIRFCCHMHISETLTARGGAGQTRVVWHWPHSR